MDQVAERAAAAPPVKPRPADGSLHTIALDSLPPQRDWRSLLAAAHTLDEVVAVRDQARADCRAWSDAYLSLHAKAPIRAHVNHRFTLLQRELTHINAAVLERQRGGERLDHFRQHVDAVRASEGRPPLRAAPPQLAVVPPSTSQPCPSCHQPIEPQRDRGALIFYCQDCGCDWQEPTK
jgi:hypothetical protein